MHHAAHPGHEHDHGDHGLVEHQGPQAGAPALAKPKGPDGTFTPGEARQARRLGMVLALVSVFFVAELTGAIYADSVVLQADAIHLLMDVLALAMSLLAMRLAVRRPTARFTFGLRRAEPVAAIFNAILVFIATFEIVREGIEHLKDSESPRAGIMLMVASAAIFVNGISAWLLHDAIHHAHAHGHDHAHDHEHDHDHDDQHGRGDAHASTKQKKHGHALNLRGAWLHLMGDTLGSVAALVAAIIIRYGGSAAADPIASFLVAGILFLGAGRLVRDAILVLLEAAPVHLPVDAVREVVLAFDGVAEVHDLHVWTLGAGHDAITVHVHAKQPDPTLCRRLSAHLRAKFETEYVTVQIEGSDDVCGAPASRYEST
jgi:cation diffusion facilitator family transporter